jgi:hypothetical protein
MRTGSVSPAQRFVALLALAVHLAGPAAVPVAEAQAQRGQIESHVEAESETACLLGHNDRYCQLCRAITLPASSSAASVVVFHPRPVIRCAGRIETQPLQSRPERSSLTARAPPTA